MAGRRGRERNWRAEGRNRKGRCLAGGAGDKVGGQKGGIGGADGGQEGQGTKLEGRRAE
jgi:hypothetical protein